jgi:hypothetical protein
VKTTGPGQSALLLLDVVALLQRERVPYAVIGAVAAAVHGAVRASLDADAVLSLSAASARGLEMTFAATGLQAKLRLGDAEDPIPGLLALSDEFGNRVDLLLGLRGLEPAAFARAIEVPFQGQSLRFIGREDFVAMKLFAGGPLDIADAQQVFAAAAETMDLNLLRRLAGRYGREAAARLDQLLES